MNPNPETMTEAALNVAKPTLAPGMRSLNNGTVGSSDGTAASAVSSQGPTSTAGAISMYEKNEWARTEQAKNANQILPKRKLHELVKQIDPTQTLDGDVEELLVDMANDFIDRVVTFSCQLAKHRGSDVLEAKDIQLHLERNWNIRVPGYSRDDIRGPRPRKQTDMDKQRQAVVQKDATNTAKRRKTD